MNNSKLQVFHSPPKTFLRFAYGFLCIAFLLMMVQNVIRYGSYDSYRPLRSILYLVNSILLFIPILPLLIHITKKYLPKKKLYFFTTGVLLIFACIFFFYSYSNITLYLFGFYDQVLSADYARNYFGREALLHLILLTTTLFYVWYKKSEDVSVQMISGSLGRKKVSLPLQAIHWIEADDHYLKLHAADMILLKRSTMKEMEVKLAPHFIRIHRKYLINRAEIKGLVKEKRSEFLLLRSGQKLKVGKSYTETLADLNLHDS